MMAWVRERKETRWEVIVVMYNRENKARDNGDWVRGIEYGKEMSCFLISGATLLTLRSPLVLALRSIAQK